MTPTSLLYFADAIVYLGVGGFFLLRAFRPASHVASQAHSALYQTSEAGRFASAAELAASYGIAAMVTALWSISIAFTSPLSLVSAVLEIIQAFAWLVATLALGRRFVGRHTALIPIPSRIIAPMIAIVALSVIIAISLIPALRVDITIGADAVDLRLVLAVATMVVVENIYRNASDEARWHMNLPSIAIAGMAAFALLLYGDAVLRHQLSASLIDGRAIVYAMLAPWFLLGARRQRRWRRSLSLSRSAVFYSTALLLSGAFLVGISAAGEVFRRYGAGWGFAAEIALIFTGFIGVAVFATSGSARSRLKIMVLDHFFARRYDYQHEWARCLDTLGAVGEGQLEQRVIKVLADSVDSPAGAVFLRATEEQDGPFRLADVWNWPEPEDDTAPDAALTARLMSEGGILVADKAEKPWLAAFPQSWLAVALTDPQSPGPIGFVLLAPPRAGFIPDHEVFDLLRVVAREISLVLAERRAAAALAHAKRFEEAGKRFAFVAHDIKNVSNQLSLVLSNASSYMDNPEFRQDMLATLRASVDKINVMLARLKAPFSETLSMTRPLDRLRLITEAASMPGRPAILLDTDGQDGAVAMEDASFDAIISHLLDNAIDASVAGKSISVRLRNDPGNIKIEIADQGVGMSAAFIHDSLFRPFTSSKQGGFGLGAFQARELIRAAGGDIEVHSIPGQGTTMSISLPRVEAAMPQLAAQA
jgi:putative PEP-CTERM system histidine kinase